MSPKQQKILAAVVALLVVAQVVNYFRLSSALDRAYQAEFRANAAEARAMNVESRLGAISRDVQLLKLKP